MAFDKDRITELTFKYVAGDITPAEWAELQAYLAGDPERLRRFEQRISPDSTREKLAIIRRWETAKEKSRRNTIRMIREEGLTQRRIWPSIAVAAGVLVIISGGILIRAKFKHVASTGSAVAGTMFIRPGGNRATLQLGNGSLIALDSAGLGRVAQEGNSTVVKAADGRLVYKGAGTGSGSAPLRNLITTPRGGQYQVELPDGSRVWLNAASSLSFPVSFTGDCREVDVTGEAYFEIAPDAGRTFIVKTGRESIRVLGTRFTVSNYPDEPVTTTTLISGAVRVVDSTHSVLLKPGEEASVGADENPVVSKADTLTALGWRDGVFRFNGASIDEVMRQLARWYDIQVVFVGEKPTQTLTAAVSRDQPASEVLSALAASGYHFKIENSRIEVMR